MTALTETTATFTVSASWAGTMKEGRGELGGAGLRLSHSAPAALGGAGVGTNPEELLAAAAASCALITLAAILAAQGKPARAAGCETIARFAETPAGPKPAAILHRITLAEGPGSLDPEALARRVERNCMISQALAGSVQTEVRIEIAPAAGRGAL